MVRLSFFWGNDMLDGYYVIIAILGAAWLMFSDG